MVVIRNLKENHSFLILLNLKDRHKQMKNLPTQPETPRLIGYLPEITHFDHYQAMFQNEDFVSCFGVKFTDEQLENIIQRDMGHWQDYGIGPYVWFDKENNQFVGEGGLNRTMVEDTPEIELTYSLQPNYWGKGLAVEIGQLAIDLAFNYLNLDHIVCFTLESNTQSQRVMEKLGFYYAKDFIHANLLHQLYHLDNKK